MTSTEHGGGVRRQQSAHSQTAVRSRLVDRRHSSLLSANQFRRPIGIRRQLASRGPHTGSSTVTSVGGKTVLTAVGAVAGWGGGGQSRAPSALLKIIYVSSFPSRPSVRLCVCLCAVRSE